METVNIGLLGLGNVGQGVYNILETNGEKITNSLNKNLKINKILVNNVNKKRNIDISKELLTTNVNEILNNEKIDIVVELLGGINPAYDYMKQALENKKHVVTANKAVIATHGKELIEIANKNNVALRFEASVGGGIPIINTLSQSLSVNKIEEMVGIINGTTNYILTQMTDYGMSFDKVLKTAQEKGFAEADPTSDIEGEDVAYKLAILISIAFGIQIPPANIPREGITKISKDDIEYASQFGYKVKLLATAKKTDNNLEFHVHPTLIPNNHPIASVNNEYNALFIKGNAVGNLMLYGKGAGSLPTGSAVLGDILEVSKLIGTNFNTSIAIPKNNESINYIGEGSSKYYIHMKVIDEPGVLGNISMTFGKYGISLESVIQRTRGEESVPIIFITHEISRENLDKALEELKNDNMVKGIASILRVETM